jgi:hypothetical protein
VFREPSTVITITARPTSSDAANYDVVSTRYVTSGNLVSKVVVVVETVE